MNGKRAKALRRAAREAGTTFPHPGRLHGGTVGYVEGTVRISGSGVLGDTIVKRLAEARARREGRAAGVTTATMPTTLVERIEDVDFESDRYEAETAAIKERERKDRKNAQVRAARAAKAAALRESRTLIESDQA